MEQHINANEMSKIQQLNCCHSEYYSKKMNFQFLPGHVVILLALPKYAREFCESSQTFQPSGNEKFPFILNELIQTVENNMYTDKNHASYSDTIRFFATYVFLLCGRSCYEMLRANLPFPSVKTIRKLTYLCIIY